MEQMSSTWLKTRRWRTTWPSRSPGSSPTRRRRDGRRRSCLPHPRPVATLLHESPRCSTPAWRPIAQICTSGRGLAWASTYDGLLHMVRPAMAGGVLATCLCPEARPQMASVRPGVFALSTSPRRPRVEHLDVSLSSHRSARRGDRTADQQRRRRSPRCGRGDRRWRRLRPGGLAPRRRPGAGDRRADRSFSWCGRGRARREGTSRSARRGPRCTPSSTWRAASPARCNTPSGMQDSSTIVAINRDPNAVIFRLSHFGVVADVGDAVPQLVAAFSTPRVESRLIRCRGLCVPSDGHAGSARCSQRVARRRQHEIAGGPECRAVEARCHRPVGRVAGVLAGRPRGHATQSRPSRRRASRPHGGASWRCAGDEIGTSPGLPSARCHGCRAPCCSRCPGRPIAPRSRGFPGRCCRAPA